MATLKKFITDHGISFGSKKEDSLMTQKFIQDCIRRQIFALFHFVKFLPKGNDFSSKMFKIDIPQDVR